MTQNTPNTPDLWLPQFPWPPAQGHKYNRGHLVIIGGQKDMTGASRLAALSALRTSAGLVTIFCDEPSHLIYATTNTSVMTKIIASPVEIISHIESKTTNGLLIGPGKSANDVTHHEVMTCLSTDLPVILDAGAITTLKGLKWDVVNTLKERKHPTILTPHEGEFTDTFGTISDRSNDALGVADATGCVIVLKGPTTIIASPTGQVVAQEGSPATLATAGSGDVLSGIIASLTASGMPAFEAACAAVYIHTQAAKQMGYGLIADDIITHIPTILDQLHSH